MLSVRERSILYGALVLASAAAWSLTWLQSSEGSPFAPYLVQTLCGNRWSTAGVGAAVAMWICMTVAMMLPSAAPTIDAFATISRRRRARHEAYTPTAIFVTGYLLAWGCFSVAAALIQSQLYRAVALQPTARGSGFVLFGTALMLAGLYQFTPSKTACMRGCRSPLTLIIAEWREGRAGALVMGLRHGLLCIGCCWAVMALMFCVSVMDLRWAAALAIYTMTEKMAPGGDTVVAPAFAAAAILGGAGLLGWCLFAT